VLSNPKLILCQNLKSQNGSVETRCRFSFVPASQWIPSGLDPVSWQHLNDELRFLAWLDFVCGLRWFFAASAGRLIAPLVMFHHNVT